VARRRYPLVGDLPSYLRNPTRVLIAAAAEPGDVARLWIGRPTLLVKRTVDVGHVLAVNNANYEKTPRLIGARGRRIAGEGIFTTANDDALARRRPVQALLHRRGIADLGETISACADRVLDAWRPDRVVDLRAEMSRVGRAVLVHSMFGPDPPRALADGIGVRRRRLARALAAPVELPATLPLAVAPSGRRALREFERELAQAIRARRSAPANDLLSALVTAGGAGLDDAKVRAEVMTLALAGLESVTRALSWTLWALAEHPDAAARVRREVASTIGSRRPRGDDWPHLVDTEAAVLESLRLLPPTPVIDRVARAADRLPTGAAVAPGTKVLVSPLVMHRDPSLHPDPERFDPDRFTPEARRRRSRFAYLPFGAGPRTCLGRNLALLEAVLVATRVAQRFDLEPLGRGPAVASRPPPRPGDPLPVRVHPAPV
jgi:cytochrome P450